MERMFLPPMAAVGVVMIGLLLRAEMLGEDDLLRINLDSDDMVIAIMIHTLFTKAAPLITFNQPALTSLFMKSFQDLLFFQIF